jgi:hypothetical protein
MNMKINRKSLFIFLAVVVLSFASSACTAVPPQIEPTQAPLPTVIVEPTTGVQPGLPQTEADVPRVSVQDAKAAVDSGAAVIVDVRSVEAYVISHIAGAISVPLANVEQNPAGVYKNKEQWIITYCT